jgi:hypothetical protein
MTHESIDMLATRRLRAAADKAYASAVYYQAVNRATTQGVTAANDADVRSAAASLRQTLLGFEDARLDHEHALEAAVANLRGVVHAA